MRTRTRGINAFENGSKTVDKYYRGQRIYERLGNVSQDEAETWLRQEQNRIDAESERGTERLYCDAAKQYLIECERKGIKSLATIAWHFEMLLPYVGAIPLAKVHSGSFDGFIEHRLNVDKVTPTTVNRSLEVARTPLIRSARVWRDDNGLPWLPSAPLIEMQEEDPRPPHPITWEEQKRLLLELPEHLIRPCLFAVNTGAREENVCGLRWEWERKIRELDRSVFVVPKSEVKNGKPHVIILNDVAMNVIDACRGKHKEYVFTYTDEKKGLDPDRMTRLNGRAFRKARKRANLETVRVHDLRHTYGQRLRDAGVGEEDRTILLGHTSTSMPSHYAAPTVQRLVELANRVQHTRDTPTLLRLANGF